MARRSTPERIYGAGRAAHVNRLISNGWPADQVEAAMVAWEAKADGEGRDRGASGYFDGAEAWVIERLHGSRLDGQTRE